MFLLYVWFLKLLVDKLRSSSEAGWTHFLRAVNAPSLTARGEEEAEAGGVERKRRGRGWWGVVWAAVRGSCSSSSITGMSKKSAQLGDITAQSGGAGVCVSLWVWVSACAFSWPITHELLSARSSNQEKHGFYEKTRSRRHPRFNQWVNVFTLFCRSSAFLKLYHCFFWGALTVIHFKRFCCL